MKFFTELGSCWGGAIVTPAADSAGFRRHPEEQREYRRTSKRPAKLSGGAANWKPRLNAISENTPVSDAFGSEGRQRTAGVDDRKRPVKASPKSAAKDVSDYWNFSQTMGLPAFSPTSYLF